MVLLELLSPTCLQMAKFSCFPISKFIKPQQHLPLQSPMAPLSSSNSLFFSTVPSKLTRIFASSVSFPRKTSIKSSVQTYPEAPTCKASSLYEVLQVSRTATPGQIKAAYRTLAKTYHPDASLQSSDGQDFIEINKAYLTLSDPTSRALYDMKLGFGQTGLFGKTGRGRRWETDQCW